jgi:hypothetical protein
MDDLRSVGLTGVWLGLYSYPRQLEPVSFTATLIETSGAISDSTHETPRQGKAAARTIFATRSGRRNDSAAQFTKTYDDGIPHEHSINYDGMITDDGAEIEGRRSIPRMWSGRFLMIRSAPNAEKIVRKKYERIST